jgi:hypothetical protein
MFHGSIVAKVYGKTELCGSMKIRKRKKIPFSFQIMFFSTPTPYNEAAIRCFLTDGESDTNKFKELECSVPRPF